MVRTLVYLTVAVLLPLGHVAAQNETTIPATVYQTVNVRSGAGAQFEIVQRVNAGSELMVDGRETDGGWLHVVLEDGASGWVPLYVLILEADPEALPIVGTLDGENGGSTSVSAIAFGRVNVRSGPGIMYDIVAQLDVEQEAEALARSSTANDWLYIQSGDVTGWVAYFTVQITGDPDALPVRVPDGSGEALIHPTLLIPTRFNTRLHADATLNSDVLTLIPFAEEVIPLAQSADGEWLLVDYDETRGWAAADLLDLAPDQLATIPEYMLGMDYVIGAEGILQIEATPDSVIPRLGAEGTPEATAIPD